MHIRVVGMRVDEARVLVPVTVRLTRRIVGSMCVLVVDVREVRTKFSKTFTTNFFNLGDDITLIFDEWIRELRERELWGNDDPVFPATNIQLGPDQAFLATGLKRVTLVERLTNSSDLSRCIHGDGAAVLSSHTFRRTLVALGQALCQTPEDFKAWSQNLGHEAVLTTFTSYGGVSPQRQAEILSRPAGGSPTAEQIALAVARELRSHAAAGRQ